MSRTQLENAFVSERSRLLRWMTSLTGDPNAADDLVQETFVEAWQNQNKLHDPSGIASWLNAIAHNIYKRWRRRQGLQVYHEIDLVYTVQDPLSEYDLERGELADLLDKALGMLPFETRAILLARYLEEQPQSKVARDMGLSESTVAVRLHRGKLALRKMIDAEQQTLTESGGWQETRIWCGNCGQGQYKSRFNSETGELTLICPKCAPDARFPAWSTTKENELLRGMKAIRPAFKRLMTRHNELLRPALPIGFIECMSCGTPAPLQRKLPDIVPTHHSELGIHFECPKCKILNYTALSGIAGSLPQAIIFKKNNPRVRVLQPQHFEYEGHPAILIRIESLRNNDYLDALFARDTYEILSVYCNGKLSNEI